MGFATARRFKRKQSDIETRTPSLNISIAAVLKPCAIFMMGIFVGVFFVSPSSITITSQVPISGVTRPNGGSSSGNLSVPSVQSLTGKNKGDDDFFSTTVAVKGKVVDQENIPARPTSHVDPTGRSIMKQQFLEAFVVPRFVGVSLATLKPGQEVTKHEHESLHEFFYGIEGEATVSVDGARHKMKAGTFVHATPHEIHSVKNNSVEDFKFLVFGVTFDLETVLGNYPLTLQ